MDRHLVKIRKNQKPRKKAICISFRLYNILTRNLKRVPHEHNVFEGEIAAIHKFWGSHPETNHPD